MLTIKGPIDYRRPAVFKAPHPGERDPASDPGLPAGHQSSLAKMIDARNGMMKEVRRLEGMVNGIDLAIELLTAHQSHQ